MDASTFFNSPRTFHVGGQKLVLRQLKLRELYGRFEAQIKDEYVADIVRSATAAGYRGEERRKFVAECLASMPSETDLEDRVQARIRTVHGIVEAVTLAAQDQQEVSPEAIGELADRDLPGLVEAGLWAIGASAERATAGDGAAANPPSTPPPAQQSAA